MRDKVFQGLLSIVEIKIEEIIDHFISYNSTCERHFKEIKARSYGGYEIEQCVKEFEEKINIKLTELLNEVSHVIGDCNRRFSSKQIKILEKKCHQCFDSVILLFSEMLVKEFGLTESIETRLKNKKENVRNKIEKHIEADKIFAEKRIDKALRWAIAIGVISILLTLLSIVVSVFISRG